MKSEIGCGIMLNAHASGTVVEKHDQIEPKMPVGDNQMVVGVEGGYNEITIETLATIPMGRG